MALNASEKQAARLSLIFVWLWTAVVSAHQAQGQSVELLKGHAIVPEQAYSVLIWGGVAVDAALGALMLFKPGAWVYRCALMMTGLMTLVGSVIDPTLWLHPLGPLSKNLPIMVLLWILARNNLSSESS